MALPGSGPLSLGQIRDEQVTYGGFSSTYSLRQLSSNAGKTTPDSVSEFYGYDALTFTYYAYYAAADPCNYEYYDIYEGSDGVYYIYLGGGVYDPMYNTTDFWYEYLYYEPLLDGNIYKRWEVNSTSTVLTDSGNSFSPC